MPKLTREEVTAFLGEPGHIVRLATVDADGGPRVVPIWFRVRGKTSVDDAARGRRMWTDVQRDVRVALVIDEEAAPYRKVIARGSVEVVHEPGEDDAWRDR